MKLIDLKIEKLIELKKKKDLKILVIGICGAGKSTLSKKLSEILDVPVIHLDQHYWKPNWIELSQKEWELKLSDLVTRERWVMDGNYSSSLAMRISHADMVVYLDFNRYIALFRALKRMLMNYGRSRNDCGEECPERLNWEFLKFIWEFPRNHRLRNETILQNIADNKVVIRLKNPREVKSFLKELSGV